MADLTYVTLKLVDLTYVTLKLVDLSYVTLELVDLTYVTLELVDLTYVTLELVDLTYVTLELVDLTYVTLELVNLTYVTLELVDLLTYVTLELVDLFALAEMIDLYRAIPVSPSDQQLCIMGNYKQLWVDFQPRCKGARYPFLQPKIESFNLLIDCFVNFWIYYSSIYATVSPSLTLQHMPSQVDYTFAA